MEWICEEVPCMTLNSKVIGTMLHREYELVRCKDCVYFCSEEENDAKENLCRHILMKVKPEGFCADGIRR